MFNRSPLQYSRGFTLLEILVVVVIVGIMVSMAVLSIGSGGRGKILDEEARRLTALIELASQTAILESRELRLDLGSQGYSFSMFDGEAWQPLEGDDQLRERKLPDDIAMAVTLESGFTVALGSDDEEKKDSGGGAQQVFILSSGEMSPFEIDMHLFGQGDVYQIKGGLTGVVTLTPPSEKGA